LTAEGALRSEFFPEFVSCFKRSSKNSLPLIGGRAVERETSGERAPEFSQSLGRRFSAPGAAHVKTRYEQQAIVVDREEEDVRETPQECTASTS